MTPITLDTLTALANKALAELATMQGSAALEAWRVQYLGRNGALPQLLRQVKDLPVGERKIIGKAGNDIRVALEKKYEKKQQSIKYQVESIKNETGSIPTTSYKIPATQRGHLHPLTQSLRLAQEIFAALGFQFVEGPDVDYIQYNFDNLNINSEHPSRAETDTFYLQGFPDLVLRTHVSTMQSRGPLTNNLKPPFKIFYYGPTYRSEKEDATHGSVFHQYEFMVVDEKVNLSDLKSIVQTFYSLFFGRDMDIRFRPGYFPFVEPGLEVDMRDKVTHKGGWLEMAGAGMVHPYVLSAINVDPGKYQGIALGGGLDRLTMLKYGIPDIRLLYSGNTRFLAQF